MKPRATKAVTVDVWKAELVNSIASGKRSKNATPMSAPALKPRIKWSLSLNFKANKPPRDVATKAPIAIKVSII